MQVTVVKCTLHTRPFFLPVPSDHITDRPIIWDTPPLWKVGAAATALWLEEARQEDLRSLRRSFQWFLTVLFIYV